MSLTCQTLLQNHAKDWKAATVHPFLEQCKLGTIHRSQFNTWLVQDYLFVLEFTRMAARLLASAPPAHFDLLLAGLAALKDELNWFKAKATERQLKLATPPQPTCREYCQFMEQLSILPYAVQATAFWAIESAYNQGWRLPGPMPEPYREFADRWGNSGFTDYVQLLEQQADEALSLAGDEIQQQADTAFSSVAKLEQAFWQMAFAVV